MASVIGRNDYHSQLEQTSHINASDFASRGAECYYRSMTPLWNIYGHTWAVERLQRALLNGRVRHAYLLLGAESVGKETLARAFAMALNCLEDDIAARPCGKCRICMQIASGNHADILYSQADATSGALKIEEVRTVAGKLALKPYDARYRVAIFRDFDHAQPRAQDALLKTLEEPAPHAVLILLAQSPEAVLPTITSRSQVLPLRPVLAAEVEAALLTHGADADKAALLAGIAGGRIGWALSALADETLLEQRTTALDLLENALGQGRAGRFALADDLAKEKLALYPLLELWASYWRDALHLSVGSEVSLANRDRAEHLRRLAGMIGQDNAVAALRATQQMIGTLDTNANVRLALEVMFLDYPGLRR
jgi:DNA polymerase III subunit delta'